MNHKTMNRIALISVLLCSVLQPCVAHQKEENAPCAEHIISPSLTDALNDALGVYHELRYLVLADTLKTDAVQHATEMIRPHCIRLAQLPPDTRQKVIMLADAVLWQGQWMQAVYAGECGIDYEAPELDEGFETLVLLSNEIQCILAGTDTPPELRQAVLQLLELLGGETALQRPAQLLQQRWAKDYKTALEFFKAFCAAASRENEQASIDALRELHHSLQYFKTSGHWEMLRLNTLAEYFRLTLIDIGRYEHPFGSPILPAERCTPRRMHALAPFFESLPGLQKLLQTSLEYLHK